MKEYTKEELEKLKKLYGAKVELHRLMKRVIRSTKIGRCYDRYDDGLGLDMGGGEVYSCLKYEFVRFIADIGLSRLSSGKITSREIEFDRDLDGVLALIEEIKKRFKEFQTKRDKNKLEYLKGQKKFAKEIFGRPIDYILKHFGE